MFLQDLHTGHRNEEIIFRDLGFRGLPITPTEGKHPFDGFLPDGRSLEVKMDLRSQARHYAAIEQASIDRYADFYAHTLCYTFFFPRAVYTRLFNAGKIHNFGDRDLEGRLVTTSEMRNSGAYADQFVRSLQ